MSRMSISASARRSRKGPAVPKMGKEEIDLLAMVNKLKQDGQLEKLKVYECKTYLRMHKLRLTGKKKLLLNRIREHIEVKNDGEEKYPVSSSVLNCKGDACKGDVVMFEQNIYRRKKGAPRDVKGRLCGQRTNAGRIIKESYGTAKQHHTFTIEILWRKGYKPWPPLHPLLIKGRNLYKDKTMRQPWPDEEERNRVIKEKHERGDLARKSRAARIHEKENKKLLRLNRNRIKDNKIKEQQNMNQKQPQEPQQKVKSTNILQQRVGERKGPSPQNGEPGNTRQQHISSKATTSHHNEVFPQKGATRTFKQEFNGHQVYSNQHGGPQPKMLSDPTHTQQMFKDHHHSYQQRNEVLPQEVPMGTSRKAFVDHQLPSQQYGGSGNTNHRQMSSKPTRSTLKYSQQPPRHQNHNEEDGLKSTYREQLFDHQNNAYDSTEYDDSSFQPQGKFTQHANVYQHGSNCHENARGGHQAHQAQRPRKQDQNNAYYTPTYNDSSFQTRGKLTRHENAYQRGSSSDQYAQVNHQVNQPLRPRNQDFNSIDLSYGQDYHHQRYHD
ncbi:zinc finger CCCH domain-containing protein 62-like [Panicum miliaceum]|uniref:Zinc finger CCCH domain-containing protein 62-like n=1 Tax=Panicum miliaceum TaxID=4540 RepID=A0A3L6TN19_PANMI|nr:zinc finger CCCH domain-containing protein 62-like [Panicum miliaceum]